LSTTASKLERKWKKNPYCYYCGIKTILFKNLKGHDPNHQATIEHLISKANPLSNKKNRKRKTIACIKCNTEKGNFDFQIKIKEKLLTNKPNSNRLSQPQRLKETPKWYYTETFFRKRQKLFKYFEFMAFRIT